MCVDDWTNEVAHKPETWQRYWDDISGKELVGELVREARAEELKIVDEMKVWQLKPVSECIAKTGKKPTKVRWVDASKGDAAAHSLQPRVSAKDIFLDAGPDLSAATPTLKYLRYPVSRCASLQTRKVKTKLMFQDVQKAYF